MPRFRFRDDPQQQVATISHRLQTKKGGDTGASSPPARARARHHRSNAQSHRGNAPWIPTKSTSKPSTKHARKNVTRSKQKTDTEKTYSFQWDEEFLLPGVSDSAIIIFTVLHQAPTRAVCLGQALVEPKRFKKNMEHVCTIALEKKQVKVPLGGEEAKIANIDLAKPGKLTFTIRRGMGIKAGGASSCDAHCSEVNGPIPEEINTLALAEGQVRGRQNESPPPAAGYTKERDDGNTHANRDERNSHGGSKSKRQSRSIADTAHTVEPATATPTTTPPRPPLGTTGKTGTTMKLGDLSTVWWVCVWQGVIKVFRHVGDAQAKLTLPLDRWTVASAEEEPGGRPARPDLWLVSASPKRWLVLRCVSRKDKLRFEEIIARNQAGLAQRAPAIVEKAVESTY
ncbi:unnamed protein product [Ectocarpus fasciculatus]